MASLIWKGTGFSQLYCFVHQSPMRVVLRAELDSRKSSALREKKKEGVTKFIKCQARILTICLLPLELYFSDAVPPPLRVPGGANGKEPTYQCRSDMRDSDSIPRSGRSPEGGRGSPLQYSCLYHSKRGHALEPISGNCWSPRT